MKVVIIGGGRLGRQLMELIPSAIVIEEELDKVMELVRIFGDKRVIHGNGKSEKVMVNAGVPEASALVIATNDDHVNYLIALTAVRFGVPKIIVRVDFPENIESFKKIGIETTICPAITAAKMINSALYPDVRDVFEVPVFEESPFRGKKINDIRLESEDTMIVAVLRGPHMIRPGEDVTIEKGDHLVVCSTGKLPDDLADLIEAGEENIRPFNNLLVVIQDEEDVRVVLREAICIANSFDISLILASTSITLLAKAREKIKEKGIPYVEKMFRALDLQSLQKLLVTELLEAEAVALKVTPSMGKKKPFKAWKLGEFIHNAGVPVLICRDGCPYNNILVLMDSSERAEDAVEIAFKTALLTGGRMRLLRYHEPGEPGEEETFQLTRLARLYAVKIEEVEVEGNPTIEFVSEVTSGDFDLTVLNWNCRSVKKDIIRRVLSEAPSSVLVVKRYCAL